MPTWGDLLNELASGKWPTPDGGVDLDGMRRHHLAELAAYTGRNTVVYAADWLNTNKAGSPDLSIVLSDVQGLMEVFRGMDASKGLDLVLHSPGGDPTAADSLVRYMRSKFEHVRVIVPLAAMSAATMWALSADVIVMGKHSQLGPVDPQLNFGKGMIPAGSIKRTFEKAKEECAKDPGQLSAWVPTLNQYFPGLLEMCDDYTQLSKDLVAEYLELYMFSAKEDKAQIAAVAAEFFANDREHIAHSRGIGRDKLESLGLEIENLEDDSVLQDRVLTVYHAFSHTFGMSAVAKIVENHTAQSWIKVMPMQAPQMVPLPSS